MARPFDAIRVVDLTNVLAGPFCAYQLALLGAEVIKVEAPDRGDLARQLGADPELNRRRMGASYLAQNAGKRSLTLDLKTDEGREVFRRLVGSADVVVENFRPGVMDRLGIGPGALAAVRPNIIYCAISGFGQDGPLKDNPAYDQIIQGLAGVMGVTGSTESGPLRVGYPVSDTIGGLTAAFAISAALFRRASTGEGGIIDVSMLEATLATMGWAVSNYLIAGHTPLPMGNDNFTASPSGTFATAHGLLNVAANRQEHFEALCAVLGQSELSSDERFRDRESRLKNRHALTGEIERALATDSAVSWEAALNRAGVPAGRVLSVPEALAQSQIHARGLVRALGQVPGVDREVSVLRAGFRLSGGDPDVDRPPPTLGRDCDEILRELGYNDAQIAELRAAGAI